MFYVRITLAALAAVALTACQATSPAPKPSAATSSTSTPLAPGTPAEKVSVATATSPTDPRNCQLLSVKDAEELTRSGLKLATNYSNLLGTTPKHGGTVIQHCTYADASLRIAYFLQNTTGPAADLLPLRKADAKTDKEFDVAIGDAAYGHTSGSGATIDVALGRKLVSVVVNFDDAAKAREYAEEVSIHLVDKILG